MAILLLNCFSFFFWRDFCLISPLLWQEWKEHFKSYSKISSDEVGVSYGEQTQFLETVSMGMTAIMAVRSSMRNEFPWQRNDSEIVLPPCRSHDFRNITFPVA